LIPAGTETTYKTAVQPAVAPATTAAQAHAASQAKKASRKTKAKAVKKDEALVRHFVSSLGKAEAGRQRLATIIRSHWSCETRHWERDVRWREDACLIRNPNAACALARIRTGLQALLRRTVKQPLPVVFENVAGHLELGLSWLERRNFRL
jgi:predicted transposase YbfD/YdcC